jgi:HAD superfamily hydrolase (TIGR01509 family)
MKAVIFDFDNVIVFSEPFHNRAITEIFREQMDLELPSSELKEFSGTNYVDRIKSIFDKRKIPYSNADVTELSSKMRDRFDTFEKHVILVPGLITLLDRLAKNNMRTAISSSGRRNKIIEALDRHRIRDRFRIITSIEDVKNPKPDPEGYLITVSRLKLDPKECTVIEDSVPGIIAAKKAGMRVIALTTTTPRVKLNMADQIIENYDEL